MHLDRVLIVTERIVEKGGNIIHDGGMFHMRDPLQYLEMVDNIDILPYNEYTPNCDDALINYCLQKKPQAVLLSLQNLMIRQGGAPTPDAVGRVTHELHIPTVMFWFDIYNPDVAKILELYLHSITLNMIGGADASCHKPLPLEGTNYMYAVISFDERVFNIPEGERDIPVGFIGRYRRNRFGWIEGLKKHGISPYIGGGAYIPGSIEQPNWMPYEGYLKLMSRLKIALNFTLVSQVRPVFTSNKGYLWERLDWLARRIGPSPVELVKHPLKIRKAVPILKDTVKLLSESMKKPRHMLRARVSEALWCRTFLLEEDNPVTSIYFEPYVDYVPFTTLKDLVHKIRYYLKHNEERDRIRMQGRATVEKYYNARIFWENIFEMIGLKPNCQYPHQAGEIWNKEYFDNWFSVTNAEK